MTSEPGQPPSGPIAFTPMSLSKPVTLSMIKFRHMILTALSALLAACGGGSGGPPEGSGQMPPTEVNVAQVVSRDVTEWDEFNGRFAATDSVQIRPRVSGYITRIAFEEGAEVAKGDVLVEIDDREYRAALARTQADLNRAQTRVKLAERDLERGRKLVAAKAMSGEEWDQKSAEVDQAKADVVAMRAAVEQARLNMDFTKVTAPISGRVGAAMITEGNLVDPSSILTTLVSLDPIYVWFEGDERTFLRYQDLIRGGDRPSARDGGNPVRVGLTHEDGFPHDGVLDFVDNQLDPASGTIRVRARLDNAERRFTPGLFARVQLVGSAVHPAMLIHEQAVMTDQDRKYVYVVGENNSAQRKDVMLGGLVDGLRIVDSGLDAADRVVINGTKKIFYPGAPLKPVDVPMNAPNTIAEAPAADAAAVPQ
jgi:membrane fusion protein, multidrug efflux system